MAHRTNRWAIFVHGCFWHAHASCPKATIPKANREWWQEKLRRNQERDASKERLLRDLGYRVIVVWECELAAPELVADRLRSELTAELSG